jgi:uroporphyrinogen-III synthase
VIVYASADVTTDGAAFAAAARGRIVLLHSVRAATRVAALLPAARRETGIAALSDAVRAAAGDGWGLTLVAGTPTDAALCAGALERAIDRAAGAGDKRP